MTTLINYELPGDIEELFMDNCYFSYNKDLSFYRYIFATFDKNGQLPKNLQELEMLAIALIKFHNTLTARIDDDEYDFYSVDFSPKDFSLDIVKNFFDVEFTRYDKVTDNYYIKNYDYDEDEPDSKEEIEIVYADDLEELGYDFDYNEFIEFCYNETDLTGLLRKNFSSTELFILIIVFMYEFDECEEETTLTNIDSYENYIKAVNDNNICKELVNHQFYIEEYSHVFEEINELI